MGFPSSGCEAFYRNAMDDVQGFLTKKHHNRYKVYNLCSERSYPSSEFQKVSHDFTFDDHNPPAFVCLLDFCIDVKNFLSKNDSNVVAVHCKAGKGRTGVMICCYLVYAGICKSAYEALVYYGMIRTKDAKGVTIPSQIRYVYYFEHFLKTSLQILKPMPYKTVVQKIYKIRMGTIPNLSKGGIFPNFKVICKGHVFYNFNKDENL